MGLFDRDNAGGIILIRSIMCGRDNYIFFCKFFFLVKCLPASVISRLEMSKSKWLYDWLQMARLCRLECAQTYEERLLLQIRFKSIQEICSLFVASLP